MKKIKLFLGFIFLIFTFLYACKNIYEHEVKNEIKIRNKLSEISSISEKNPDSALYLLKLISQDNLTPDLSFRYELLNIKLKVYLDLIIEQDSNAIRLIKNYFLVTNSSDSLIALSYFYSGYINLEFNNLSKATEDFIKSLEYSESFNTIKAKSQANIGYIYRRIRSYETAKEWYNKSYKTYLLFDKNEAAYSLVDFGDCLLLNNQPDSAIYYYKKAIELIGSEDVSFINNIIVALCHSDKYSEAKKLCLPLLTDTLKIKSKAEKHYLYMNMADIYFHTNNPDSAMYYINKINELELEDLEKLMAQQQMGFLIEQKRSDFRQALEYYKTYHNYEKEYLKDKSETMIREIKEKYDNEKLIYEKEQLIIKNQKIIFFITVSVLFILVALFSVLYKLKKTELAKKQIEINNILKEEENRQFEDEISTQKKIIDDKVMFMRDLGITQISIIKQIIELGTKKTQAEVNKILKKIYEQITYSFIVQVVTCIDNTYHEEFTKKFPFIKDNDLIICYLTLLGFNNIEIGELLDIKENSVQHRKSVIRNKFKKPDKKIIQIIQEEFRGLEIE